MLGLDLAFVEVSKWENEGASRPEAVALSNLSQGLPGFRGDLPEWSYQQAFHAKGTWRGGAKVLFPVSLVTMESRTSLLLALPFLPLELSVLRREAFTLGPLCAPSPPLRQLAPYELALRVALGGRHGNRRQTSRTAEKGSSAKPPA